MFLRWAETSLEGAQFGEASLIAALPSLERPSESTDPRTQYPILGYEEPVEGARQLPGDDVGRWQCPLHAPPMKGLPHIVSLRGAHVSHLTLSGVDARACRFAGAHGLDGLGLDGVHFAQPPAFNWSDRQRWWTRRQTLAEDHHWRATPQPGDGDGGHTEENGWYGPAVQPPRWLQRTEDPPEADEIAGIYRALRKRREDSKDEPGAADFYYGEMEMRRHASQRKSSIDASLRVRSVSKAEERVVWLYWLFSGYGLRGLRAVAALGLTIAVALFS